MGNSGMMDSTSMMNGWGMGFGPFFMLLVAAIALALLFVVLRAIFSRTSISKPNSPLEILEQRFAQGEIDEIEFDNRRRKLER